MANDALKAEMARYLSRCLTALVCNDDEDGEVLAPAGLAGLGIKSIEVHQVETFSTVIRVRTHAQGVRYFEARLREPI